MREALLTVAQQLVQAGLNKGASGNCSVRDNDGLLITPSGIDVALMNATSMVSMQMDGKAEAGKRPSSEWFFHRDIYQQRPEVNAVIHTHSMFATTMACLHQAIPAFHYMIAITGGDHIRCAPYALFGTPALSALALMALRGRKACLLANHGMIAVGASLEEALAIAVEVENLCEQYWRLLQITPTPPLLGEAEMQAVHQQFKNYRNWKR
ncbi:MAG: class II aldolase/adducin family protein [Methylophilaceae bacterium]|nr:class II aldolase/adducin family protein [Methylophilaceae bacterium]